MYFCAKWLSFILSFLVFCLVRASPVPPPAPANEVRKNDVFSLMSPLAFLLASLSMTVPIRPTYIIAKLANFTVIFFSLVTPLFAAPWQRSTGLVECALSQYVKSGAQSRDQTRRKRWRRLGLKKTALLQLLCKLVTELAGHFFFDLFKKHRRALKWSFFNARKRRVTSHGSYQHHIGSRVVHTLLLLKSNAIVSTNGTSMCYSMFIAIFFLLCVSLLQISFASHAAGDRLKHFYKRILRSDVKRCPDKTKLLPHCTDCIPGLQKGPGSESCDELVTGTKVIRKELKNLTDTRFGNKPVADRPFGLYPCKICGASIPHIRVSLC